MAQTNKSVNPAQEAYFPAGGVQRSGNNTDDVVTIDLMELLKAILGYWRMILLAMLTGGLIMACYHTFLLKPTYRADSSIFITNTESGTNLSYSEVQLSAVLTEDYIKIIRSRAVLKEVIAELDLDMDYKKLDGLINVTNPTNSHIITITATTGDVEMSRNIVNAVMNIGIEHVYSTIGTNMPTVIDHSEADAVVDVTPSLAKFLAIGAMIGFLIVCAFAVLKMLTDTTIKTESDIYTYLNVPVLAAVPSYDAQK